MTESDRGRRALPPTALGWGLTQDFFFFEDLLSYSLTVSSHSHAKYPRETPTPTYFFIAFWPLKPFPSPPGPPLAPLAPKPSPGSTDPQAFPSSSGSRGLQTLSWPSNPPLAPLTFKPSPGSHGLQTLPWLPLTFKPSPGSTELQTLPWLP